MLENNNNAKNDNKLNEKFLDQPLNADPYQIFMDFSLAHIPTFFQVLWKSVFVCNLSYKQTN